eukprot:CAMPEP_0204363446 /NCGR_PEP_ID=MMETSP0469-20131031/40385_1 /ASSEMBLY_ACC=CAM_ASM_000384 /TAXON_ID=2969 /ORGANISM="Oxyrrhis marina" /LENGTH=71 /DNA_ID=CAMNT_0051352203 /DNA_START=238 /DNA_END=451 /DNA_ORIENTATION=-
MTAGRGAVPSSLPAYTRLIGEAQHPDGAPAKVLDPAEDDPRVPSYAAWRVGARTAALGGWYVTGSGCGRDR